MFAGIVEDVPAVCSACRETLARIEMPGSAVAALAAAGPGRGTGEAPAGSPWI